VSGKNSITIHLTDEQRERLERQAKRRGVPAAKLAFEFVLAGLIELEERADRRQQETLEALAQLREIREDRRKAGYRSVGTGRDRRQCR